MDSTSHDGSSIAQIKEPDSSAGRGWDPDSDLRAVEMLFAPPSSSTAPSPVPSVKPVFDRSWSPPPDEHIQQDLERQLQSSMAGKEESAALPTLEIAGKVIRGREHRTYDNEDAEVDRTRAEEVCL